MKILLAGPGTGKTTKIKSLIRNEYRDFENILVLSFTNATVNDLKSSFTDFDNVEIYTLHSYALKINHLPHLHVLNDRIETQIVERYARIANIEFNEFCSLINCVTFQYMIENCISFIKSNPAYAIENIGELDLLIVDEFQDFNEIERELVYLLSEYSKETIILGDDDQSIYGFKDADPNGIISLYNEENIEKLEHENICYRCPDIIVDHCTNLINKNRHRIPKEWKKSNKEGNLFFYQFITHEETNQFLIDEINLIKSNSKNDSILILSPVRFYVHELIEYLENHNIQYLDFWSNDVEDELRIKIWWLNALYGKHKILFLLFLTKYYNFTRNRRFLESIISLFRENFREDAFIDLILTFKIFPDPFSEYIVKPIPINSFFEKHQDYIILKELVDEDDLVDSLNNLMSNINPTFLFDKEKVNIMSIHKSKGLQADNVFILNLNEGIIPNIIAGTDTIEAQRRLLFVGMTRAIKNLYLISTLSWEGKYVHKADKNQFKYQYKKKIYYGKTSRFLIEMKK